MRRDMTQFFKDFRDDEEGSLIIFTLILLLPMLLVAGMAVDFMRIENERIVLQGVTDRAVLSAASLTQTEEDLDLVIRDFFETAGFDPDQVTPNILKNEASGREISATAESRINTFYLRLAGMPTLDAVASSMAEEGVNTVEVSLVLDYSASMRSGGTTGRVNEAGTTRGRIGDLQDAARAFAAELLQEQYAGRFSLNIVPYGGHVNPGPEMFEYLQGNHNPPIRIEDAGFDLNTDGPFDLSNTVFWADDANEGFPGEYYYAGADGAWGTGDEVDLTNLVTANGDTMLGEANNLTPEQYNDLHPNLRRDVSNHLVSLDEDLFGSDGIYGTADDIEYMDPDGDGVDDRDLPAVAFMYDHPSHCLEVDGADWNSAGLPSNGADHVEVFMHYGYNNWEIEQQVRGWGWCLNDKMQIQYGMQDPDLVSDFFDQITLGDGTGTDIGMKWGLALLDPSSRDAFTYLNGKTIPGTDQKLVPDASLGRPSDWDNGSTDKIIILMTDGFITKQAELAQDQETRHLTERSRNARTNDWINVADTKDRFIGMCNLAKAPSRDVEIYTIAFETNNTAADLMRECASTNNHFKEADGSALTEVFVDIARQITALRLSQ